MKVEAGLFVAWIVSSWFCWENTMINSFCPWFIWMFEIILRGTFWLTVYTVYYFGIKKE